MRDDNYPARELFFMWAEDRPKTVAYIHATSITALRESIRRSRTAPAEKGGALQTLLNRHEGGEGPTFFIVKADAFMFDIDLPLSKEGAWLIDGRGKITENCEQVLLNAAKRRFAYAFHNQRVIRCDVEKVPVKIPAGTENTFYLKPNGVVSRWAGALSTVMPVTTCFYGKGCSYRVEGNQAYVFSGA